MRVKKKPSAFMKNFTSKLFCGKKKTNRFQPLIIDIGLKCNLHNLLGQFRKLNGVRMSPFYVTQIQIEIQLFLKSFLITENKK